MTELEKVPFDMKLEVVLLGVSDVDRAKAFYENLGWRLDIDIAAGDFRGVQMTPHNSEASIIFGMRWLCMRSRSRPIVLFHGGVPYAANSSRSDLQNGENIWKG